MTSKIKTIVCGSTFGQFYIDALMKYSEFFEIADFMRGGASDLLNWLRDMVFPYLHPLKEFQMKLR